MREKTFLEFGSVTYALRAKGLLERRKIPCLLARSGISNCSYGLWIGNGDLERAKALLDTALLRYRR